MQTLLLEISLAHGALLNINRGVYLSDVVGETSLVCCCFVTSRMRALKSRHNASIWSVFYLALFLSSSFISPFSFAFFDESLIFRRHFFLSKASVFQVFSNCNVLRAAYTIFCLFFFYFFLTPFLRRFYSLEFFLEFFIHSFDVSEPLKSSMLHHQINAFNLCICSQLCVSLLFPKGGSSYYSYTAVSGNLNSLRVVTEKGPCLTAI